jgi:hypothetical protein
MNPYIFVSIASYEDPLLLFTLRHAVAMAQRPELLRFAVVDQNKEDQRAAIRALPFAGQVRYCHLHPQDTLGVCWARSLAFSLYDGEAHLLQIDSHTCFEQDWDASLRRQHARLAAVSERPILSTYPYPFTLANGAPVYDRPAGDTVLVLRPDPEQRPFADGSPVLRFHARHLFADRPVPGCHVAAGFLFCAGALVEEVPYDPYLYFHGEEQSLALRCFTRGWDIYHPAWIPLYHLYKQPDAVHAQHHWHGEVAAQRAFAMRQLDDRATARLARLVSEEGLPGPYGLGTARSLDDFATFSGIDYRRRAIADPFAGRLR